MPNTRNKPLFEKDSSVPNSLTASEISDPTIFLVQPSPTHRTYNTILQKTKRDSTNKLLFESITDLCSNKPFGIEPVKKLMLRGLLPPDFDPERKNLFQRTHKRCFSNKRKCVNCLNHTRWIYLMDANRPQFPVELKGTHFSIADAREDYERARTRYQGTSLVPFITRFPLCEKDLGEFIENVSKSCTV
jgi:hypothetical protein